MPYVTKELSSKFAKAKFRPTCWKCGRFIGVGGFYDVLPVDGCMYEEGYSTCAEHTQGENTEQSNG